MEGTRINKKRSEKPFPPGVYIGLWGYGQFSMAQDIFLLVLLATGVVGQNNLVAVSCAILLLLRFLNLYQVMPYLEGPGLKIGLTLLILSIVTPFASSKVEMKQVTEAVVRPAGAIAFLTGIVGACLGARGVIILQNHPEAILGLVLGTIVGATFFKGIPVGPLVAAGMAAVILQLLGLE